MLGAAILYALCCDQEFFHHPLPQVLPQLTYADMFYYTSKAVCVVSNGLLPIRPPQSAQRGTVLGISYPFHSYNGDKVPPLLPTAIRNTLSLKPHLYNQWKLRCYNHKITKRVRRSRL